MRLEFLRYLPSLGVLAGGKHSFDPLKLHLGNIIEKARCRDVDKGVDVQKYRDVGRR